VKILVINSGSSSLKFKLYKMQDETALCSGFIEKIGEEKSFVSLVLKEHRLEKKMHITGHTEALNILFDLLFESGLIVDLDELYAVGHRVVHGGSYFSKPTRVNAEVIERLKSLIPLAPLHNPANILGMQALREKCPQLKQVAVFDTAFHHTMPAYAYEYALPKKLYKEEGIRRFGFHGSSHSYILKQTAKILEQEEAKTNIISIHLGNGASICAIEHGKSVDTSMGMTPLEGLVMGSRSGDIDAGIIFYLHRHKGYSIDEIDSLLNKHSGLVGLCGQKDMRLILEKAHDNADFKLALEIFVYRIKKYIGAYLAVLNRTDAIVFTGGIGENSSEIRSMVCEGLQGLGLQVNEEENMQTDKRDFSFHDAGSRIKLMVVSTDEELEIARQTKETLMSALR